jgi:NADH:ubiquinone reductase (H+-translocating)
MGSEFAVNEVLGIKITGLMAVLFWRATYLYRLESPQSRARIVADWPRELFNDLAVTEIRSRE